MVDRYQTPNESEDAFHQLQGNLGLKCALNSVRICNCLVTYCQGNPYTLNTPLRKITSSVLIPVAASADILYYPEKFQERFKSLITNISKRGIKDRFGVFSFITTIIDF